MSISPDDESFSYRHSVTSLVFAAWTSGQDLEASLSEHFFDGTYSALELYVMEGAPDNKWGRLIPTEHAQDLSYELFEARYMATNSPVVVAGATSHWKANDDLTKYQTGSVDRLVPDVEVLKSRFGDDVVEVEPPSDVATYSTPRSKMCLRDYSMDQGYVKDWHLLRSFASEGQQLFPTPYFFRDDWLNAHSGSTYHFVYLGGEGSSTHLHTDVLGSFSWSANVCGQKLWKFLPPRMGYLVRDVFGRAIAPGFIHDDDAVSCEENKAGTGSSWRFPLLHLARAATVRQGAESAVFVPSEWLHTVQNEAPTLSVNANWFNRHNLHLVAHRFGRERAAARAHAEIARSIRALKTALTAARLRPRETGIGNLAFRAGKPCDFGSPDGVGDFNSRGGLGDCSSHASHQGRHGPGGLSGIGCHVVGGVHLNSGPEQFICESDQIELGTATGSGDQYGKAPFDERDFLRLLRWKATALVNEAGGNSDEGRDSAAIETTEGYLTRFALI